MINGCSKCMCSYDAAREEATCPHRPFPRTETPVIKRKSSVRIVKEGVDPKTYPIEFTCLNCGTVFETSQDEAKHVPAYDQREGAYFSFDCPVCKHSCSSTKTVKPSK